MRCIVCDKNDWEKIDQYRYKPEEMSLCKGCGFISYPKRWKSKEDILKFYRKDYRTPPTVENLFQGQRKIGFHEAFLREPILDRWTAEGKEDPVIFEVGAAFGLVLAWFKAMRHQGKQLFPKADLSGSELTLSFRRNAYHLFNQVLNEDFDDSKKYDLIVSYKVAEHQLDVDQELARYRAALKPDGMLYISVPIWFKRLNNFGVSGFTLDYYYAPEHVNTWSEAHFLAVLNKAGFKIVKENHSYYDDTYLCVPGEMETPKLPSVAEIKENLERVKEADTYFQRKEFSKAYEVWPNFPMARRAYYEYNRNAYHSKGIDVIMKEVVAPWLAIDKESYEACGFGADILMRYDRYKDAIRYLTRGLDLRPRCETFLGAIANCHRALAQRSTNEEERIKHIQAARDVMAFIRDNSMVAFRDAVTWLYADNACLPMPGEPPG